MKSALVTMTFFIFTSLLQGSILSPETHQEVTDEVPDISLFFQVMLANPEEAEVTLEEISKNWKNGYASMLIELIFQMNPAGGRMLTPGGNVATTRKAANTWIDSSASPTLGANDLVFPNSALSQRRVNSKGFSPQDSLFDENAMVRRRLISFVQEQTGQNFLYDLGRWQQWIWNNPYDPHPDDHTAAVLDHARPLARTDLESVRTGASDGHAAGHRPPLSRHSLRLIYGAATPPVV